MLKLPVKPSLGLWVLKKHQIKSQKTTKQNKSDKHNTKYVQLSVSNKLWLPSTDDNDF